MLFVRVVIAGVVSVSSGTGGIYLNLLLIEVLTLPVRLLLLLLLLLIASVGI